MSRPLSASALPLLVLLVSMVRASASFEHVKSSFHKSAAHREQLLKIGKEGLEERARKLSLTDGASASSFKMGASSADADAHTMKNGKKDHDGRKLQTGYEWVRVVTYPMMGCQGAPESFQAGMLNECQAGLMIGGNMASKKYVAIHPSTIGGDFYLEEHWYFGQTCSGAVQAVFDIGRELGIPSNYQYGECTDVTEVAFVPAHENVMPMYEGIYSYDSADGCVQNNNLVHFAEGTRFGACIYNDDGEEDRFEMFSSEGCPAMVTMKEFSGMDPTCSSTPLSTNMPAAHLCELDLEEMMGEIEDNGAAVFEYHRRGCWPVGLGMM